MSINKEILSLELERIDLLGKLSKLERYLQYADGQAYADDCAKIAEYKHRITKIEIELLKIRDKVDVEKCKEAVRKLHDTLYTLNKLHNDGYMDCGYFAICKQHINIQIEKLNSRCKYHEQTS